MDNFQFKSSPSFQDLESSVKLKDPIQFCRALVAKAKSICYDRRSEPEPEKKAEQRADSYDEITSKMIGMHFHS